MKKKTFLVSLVCTIIIGTTGYIGYQTYEKNQMSQYIIQTRDLTKTYGEQKSVSNLNMHVRKGKIYGLLGRNGAGKTTTMKML